ncbi:MAG: hypothetical protein ACO1N3_01295, partial [Gammaproteobacteria bacterium]
MKSLLWIIRIMLILSMTSAQAKIDITEFSHDFWLPYYHKQRLSYCSSDHQSCGLSIANLYCQKLGYKRAEKATIDHNVGISSYLNQKKCCIGWQCSGFKLIRCIA